MKTPKSTEEKMERILNAWRTLAPDKSFGGMTLAQLEAVAAPSRAARQKIATIEDQMAEALAERDHADEAFEAKAKLVVAGVLADPTEGADSALYEAFGYTRASAHKTGLTRRKRNQPPKP